MKAIVTLKVEEDDVKKIFPSDYYTKFAHHLLQEILQFQKDLANKPLPKSHINFVSHSRNRKRLQLEDKKARINFYDQVPEIIEKNKQQLERMNRYSSILEKKLQAGPKKKKISIKSPLKERNEIESDVMLRLKALDQEELNLFIKEKEELKVSQEKLLKCKFTSRRNSKTARFSSPKLSQFIESLQNRESRMAERKSVLKHSSSPKLKITKMRSYLANSYPDKQSKEKSTPFSLLDSVDIRGSSRAHSYGSLIKGRNKQKKQKIDLLLCTKKIKQQTKSLQQINVYKQNEKHKMIKKALEQEP